MQGRDGYPGPQGPPGEKGSTGKGYRWFCLLSITFILQIR